MESSETPAGTAPASAGDDAAAQPRGARFQPDHMLPDAERGKALLYRMLLIRRFEERAGEMYARAKIGGFLHLCIGEEATVVGTTAAMRDSDYLISTYREHGQVLARGTSPNAVMAELFGRVDGVSKGRGGSMHMFDVERRFMGGYGIVGGHLPIAAGLALAATYKGTDDAVVCMLGDGATNQGTFGETLNLAALWRLPMVFIVVNNQFGMGTSVARHSAVTDLSAKGEGLGVPGTRCDGMDVLDVESCVRTALEHVRSERRPLLIESVTYRFRGHSMADPEEYRTKEEVDEWRRRDPIMQFANRLIGGGEISGTDAEQLDHKALAEVDAAVQFADQSPFPAFDSLYDNVYVLGDQLRGWYSVDTRSPVATRGERIGGDAAIQRLAEAGAAHVEGEEFDEQIVMRDGHRRDAVSDSTPPLPLPRADDEPGPMPARPADQPTELAQPAGQTMEPTQPTDRETESAQPAEPAQQPGQPTELAQPAGQPIEPSQPADQLTEPSQPADQLTEPSQPAPPPAEPAQPAGQPQPKTADEVVVPQSMESEISFEPLPAEDENGDDEFAADDDYLADDVEIVFEPLPHEEDDLSFGRHAAPPAPLPLPSEPPPPPLPLPPDDDGPPPLPTPDEPPEGSR